ncbi:MAG: GIY-YIG nuclease family protein [Oscillospiraceae bacterium]|nr:GIY-YIG nuclease family protein [Oscillospiraceae bacterium]
MYYVYILTNKGHSVLYIGVTNNLERRTFEHKNHLVPGFTDRYNVEKLIYFETCSDINIAITREKELKSWNRKKKEALIDSINPEWNDLSLSNRIFFES